MSRRKIVTLLVVALVVLGLGAGVARALSKRSAAAAAAAAPKAERPVELAAADLYTAAEGQLTRRLELSGSLKAPVSALVKARVAAELKELSVREGDAVRAGQVLARLDSTEVDARLRQAEQQALSAKAQVDIAQRELTNNQKLVDQGFISSTALDRSRATLEGAKASVLAADAAADVARKAVADTVLRSPINGWVSQRLAQPGERVSVDARIVEVVDLSRLELEATVAAGDIGQVRVGATGTARVEGLADQIAIEVVRINPAVQAGARLVPVYLAVRPADKGGTPGLKQGLFAQGMLDVGRASGLVIPLSLVRTDKAAPYVLVVAQGADGLRVAERPVTLGERGANDQGESVVLVRGGLKAGDRLLQASAGNLRTGSLVVTR
jgi:RND family efflux transporter MFP subunit